MCKVNVVHICSLDRLTLFYSLSVTPALTDILTALLNGAAIYPFDPKSERASRLGNWLIENEITLYHSVPTVFRHFVAALTGGEEFSELRLLYVSGEPLNKRDVID